jgi:hypothetical protein
MLLLPLRLTLLLPLPLLILPLLILPLLPLPPLFLARRP